MVCAASGADSSTARASAMAALPPPVRSLRVMVRPRVMAFKLAASQRAGQAPRCPQSCWNIGAGTACPSLPAPLPASPLFTLAGGYSPTGNALVHAMAHIPNYLVSPENGRAHLLTPAPHAHPLRRPPLAKHQHTP